MKVLDRTSDGLKRCYSILLAPSEIEQANLTKLKDVAGKVKLDGFRPGKVPLDVVKRLYGDSLIDEAKKAAMESASRQIFKEENLSISFHFANDIVKEDENGLEFTLKFELIPDFELKDHSSIKLFKYVVDITEDDINKLLDDIRRYKKRWIEDKKSKEVNEGQRIAIDMRLLSQLNKKVSENIEELEITIGDKSLVDDFWKHLIGMKVGEAREFDIQYPKDFSDKNFSGKKLRYSASIKKILKGEEYSLDDEFAKALGYEDFDKLKVWAKSSLTSRYEYMSQEIAKRELLEQMSQMYDFQVPSNMVAIEKSEVERQIKSEAPKYNKEFTPEIAAECLSIAEKRVRLGFIVAAIAKTEKVSVTQKEIAQAIKNVVAM